MGNEREQSAAGRSVVIDSVPQRHKTSTPEATQSTTSGLNDDSKKIIEDAVLRPIPTMGWPAFWYSVQKMFSKTPVPLKLSKKELAAIAEAERLLLRKRTIVELVQLGDEVETLTVAFVNTKGSGAKTTTWAYVSCILSEILRKPLTAADYNFGSGNGASRLGRDADETMTQNQFRHLIATIKDPTFRDINPKLRRNRYGVAVLSSNDQTEDENDVYGTNAEVMLNRLSDFTDFLMLDTGNDITTTVMKKVLDKADVIVFTANVEEPDSLIQLGTSMEIVRKLGHRGKVDRSIVAISNLPAGADAETYRKYTDRVKISGEVVKKYNFDGLLTGIPHDSHMKKSGLIELEIINNSTEQAYLELAVLILQQGLEAKRHTPKAGTALVTIPGRNDHVTTQ